LLCNAGVPQERRYTEPTPPEAPTPPANNSPFPIPHSPFSTLTESEDAQIAEAIHSARGNITEAARALGISRRTIQRKFKTSATIREAAESATSRRRNKFVN